MSPVDEWQAQQERIAKLRDDLRTARTRATNNGQDRDNMRRALERLLREYDAEESEHGFPLNFALRDAHRQARALLASTPQPSEEARECLDHTGDVRTPVSFKRQPSEGEEGT